MKIVALAALFSCVEADGASCTSVKDIDMHTPSSKKFIFPNPAECCSLCSNTTKCVAYSWHLFNSKTNGNCWLILLPDTPGRLAGEGYVSGIVPGRPTPPPTPALPTPPPPTPIPQIPCAHIPAPSPPPPYAGPFYKFQLNVANPEQQPNCSYAQPWVDEANNPIDAHGGGILHDTAESGQYFWYGTLRFNHTQHASPYVPSPGVNCYSSTDLYNWKYEGFVFNASLTGGLQVERPKVIYNRKTKTYVLWSKIMHSGHQVDHSDRMAVVAVSKSPIGPFELAKGVQWFAPDNRSYADATLFVDDDDRAYTAFRGAGKSDGYVHVYRLTDDYLNVTTDSVVVEKFEGVTMFKKDKAYFLWGSNLSPYPAKGKPFHTSPVLYISDSGPLGNYSCVLGKGKLVTDSHTWAAQSTFVLPNPNKKRRRLGQHTASDEPDFIWMGDQWLVDSYFFGLYAWLPLYVDVGSNGSVTATLEWRSSWGL